MLELLVIADDFTGALDTGVQFSKKGIKTLVSTNLDMDIAAVKSGIKVLVLDTESRHTGHEEAYGKVKKVAQNAMLSGIKRAYKKTDSTLRGNIGSELEALMDAYGMDVLMFIPAFPKTGRTTVNGHQYVNGIPIHKTVFAKDPLEPAKDSYIPDIIKKQTSMDTVVITADMIERGSLPIHDKKAVLIFDCDKDEELFKIGRLLKKAGMLKITAGCAGFASVLPKLLELEDENRQYKVWDKEAAIKKGSSPGMLVVCGSVNEYSLKQVKYAEKYGFASITLNPEQNLSEGYFKKPEGTRLVEKIVKGTAQGSGFIIKTVNSREETALCNDYAVKTGIDGKSVPMVVARNIGKLVKEILKNSDIGNLVIFGGDTAVAVMNELECDGMLPGEEIVPGVVASQISSDRYSLQLVTKAGGFGSEKVLEEIRDYLCK